MKKEKSYNLKGMGALCNAPTTLWFFSSNRLFDLLQKKSSRIKAKI